MSFDVTQYKRYHFLGIGGIGMSALAQMLFRLGYRVTGSDTTPGTITRALEAMGMTVTHGHAAENVRDADCVIFSSSVTPDNPEYAAAIRRGLPLKHRSQLLAALAADKRTLAVAGTHGKTTTTAMIGWVYAHAGRDPCVIVGGNVSHFGGNLLMGSGRDMILEADESDASFLEYRPDEIVVTNIDYDHMDYFRDMRHIREKYAAFLDRLRPGGRWYACADCPVLSSLAKGAVRYGTAPDADYRVDGIQSRGAEGMAFDLFRRGGRAGRIQIRGMGRHNVLNAAAAAAVALENGLNPDKVREALSLYNGTARRFDVKHRSDRLIIIDDYAHHPTEIRTTIDAARHFASRRLVVVFQPHRYSRTRFLAEAFTSCFDAADEVIVTDVYAAGEKPITGVTGEDLTRRIRAHRPRTDFVPRPDLARGVEKRLKPGDVVILMGAGDITRVADELKDAVEEGRHDG